MAASALELNSLRYIFLIVSVRGRGKKISARRLFNYTNLHGATPERRTIRILRTRKAGWKSSGTRTSPFHSSPLSVERRNLPVFLAPLQPPRTKCYPCSLTLISRMQYNREHNLEIARIIPATGLIKAYTRPCMRAYVRSVSKLLAFNYSFSTEK